MVPDLHEINGIEEYTEKQEKTRTIFFKGDKAFLVQNKNTIEVRCDEKLSHVLQQDYDLTASDNRLPGLFLRLRNCFRLQRKTSDDHQKISPLIMELRFFSTLGSRSPRISLLLMPFVLQMMLIISSGSKPTSLFEILTVLPLMMVLVI